MSTGGYRRPGTPSVGATRVNAVFGYVSPGYSGGTLVPMASSMARRLALIVATAAAAMVVAVPAQARTLYTLTGHGWGHGIGLSQYGALGYAQHGWAYDAILAHYYRGTTLSALPGSVQMRIQLASGRTSYSISGASKITVVDEGGSVSKRIPAGYTASSGERRVACASSTRPRTRGSSSTSPAPSAWAPRRRFESTAPSASAGRMTTGTAICASSAPARRSCSSTSCRSSTTCAASCRARCRPRGCPRPFARRPSPLAPTPSRRATRRRSSTRTPIRAARSTARWSARAAGSNAAVADTAHMVLWYSGERRRRVLLVLVRGLDSV